MPIPRFKNILKSLFLDPKSNQGFTLIEILVAIAILAIVAYATIPNFHSSSTTQLNLNSVNDFVATLKSAQINTETGVVCPGTSNTSLFWAVSVTSGGYALWASCNGTPTFAPSPYTAKSFNSGLNMIYPYTSSNFPTDPNSTCFIRFQNNNVSTSAYCYSDVGHTTADNSLSTTGKITFQITSTGNVLYKCVQIKSGGAIYSYDPVNNSC